MTSHSPLRRALVASPLALALAPATAHAAPAAEVVLRWYDLILELVRHTPTYSPPVASRAFAYFGVTAYEAVAGGSPALTSLAGQLNGLDAPPARDAAAAYDDATVLQGAMAHSAKSFFWNTGPTGQRALTAFEKKMAAAVTAGLDLVVVSRSLDLGAKISEHVLAWSQNDGGAVIENMGFPMTYELQKGPSHWVPTSTIGQQQTPLLPNWGKNRPFVLKDGAACRLPPPLDYSEDPASDFYKQAYEVYTTAKTLSDEQKVIARFWSDDPMLSPTPPGHWIGIAVEILARQQADAARCVDVLTRLGVAIADGFIACWDSKFTYDMLRPVTYIRRVIDKTWEPLLITPPFPEYPSGHASQSGAAATVLDEAFGNTFAFDDATHERDGLKARHFVGFWAAAEEAAISRMYGGIHFRAANERGLLQGRCVGEKVNALKTLKS